MMNALRIMIVALVNISAGCSEPTEACFEAQHPLAIPATGTLHITYGGRFGNAPSTSFSTYVFVPRHHVIEVSGCGLDDENTLWRFWSEWAFPDGTTFPAEIRATSDLPAAIDTNIPGFWANFLHCREGDCVQRTENILRVSGFGNRPQGSGRVEAFNVEAGRFLATAPLTTDHDETLSVTADITWPPSAFTFSNPVSDAGLSDAASDGGL